MKIFIPKMYQKDIYTINYPNLKKLGYKLLIFDLDNTIGSIKEKTCSLKSANFLKSLKKDFIVLVASNSSNKRVQKFLSNVDCNYFSLSLKPTLRILKKIKRKYKIDYQEMVIIGDQVLTDIFLGNRKGLMTILVDPILNEDFKITSLNRKLEKVINKKNKITKGVYYE